MTDKKPVQWLCIACGKTHATRPAGGYPVAFNHGKCDCYGIKTSVTSARNYGVWEIPNVKA